MDKKTNRNFTLKYCLTGPMRPQNIPIQFLDHEKKS